SKPVRPTPDGLCYARTKAVADLIASAQRFQVIGMMRCLSIDRHPLGRIALSGYFVLPASGWPDQ
ncbi:hypothetical protein, partial [Methylobacterium haplocladii]|uniref:hypothetical protein n=1 Tax=Methylobacterium haplocladii TaxID=1176176 RepID=UPI001AEE021B